MSGGTAAAQNAARTGSEAGEMARQLLGIEDEADDDLSSAPESGAPRGGRVFSDDPTPESNGEDF